METLAVIFAIAGTLLPLAFIVYAIRRTMRSIRRGKRERPFVAVCTRGSATGVVAMYDYERASKAFWESVLDGDEKYDEARFAALMTEGLTVLPVFVFPEGAPELIALLQGCHAERRWFAVGAVPGDFDARNAAWLALRRINRDQEGIERWPPFWDIVERRGRNTPRASVRPSMSKKELAAALVELLGQMGEVVKGSQPEMPAAADLEKLPKSVLLSLAGRLSAHLAEMPAPPPAELGV